MRVVFTAIHACSDHRIRSIRNWILPNLTLGLDMPISCLVMVYSFREISEFRLDKLVLCALSKWCVLGCQKNLVRPPLNFSMDHSNGYTLNTFSFLTIIDCSFIIVIRKYIEGIGSYMTRACSAGSARARSGYAGRHRAMQKNTFPVPGTKIVKWFGKGGEGLS